MRWCRLELSQASNKMSQYFRKKNLKIGVLLDKVVGKTLSFSSRRIIIEVTVWGFVKTNASIEYSSITYFEGEWQRMETYLIAVQLRKFDDFQKVRFGHSVQTHLFLITDLELGFDFSSMMLSNSGYVPKSILLLWNASLSWVFIHKSHCPIWLTDCIARLNCLPSKTFCHGNNRGRMAKYVYYFLVDSIWEVFFFCVTCVLFLHLAIFLPPAMKIRSFCKLLGHMQIECIQKKKQRISYSKLWLSLRR